MELMLALETKEARAEQSLPIREAAVREFVGTYTNGPERVELLVKQGKFLLRGEDGEFPISKTGDDRFTISKPGEAESEEVVLVRGVDGKPEYLHIGRHALKMVRPRK